MRSVGMPPAFADVVDLADDTHQADGFQIARLDRHNRIRRGEQRHLGQQRERRACVDDDRRILRSRSCSADRRGGRARRRHPSVPVRQPSSIGEAGRTCRSASHSLWTMQWRGRSRHSADLPSGRCRGCCPRHSPSCPVVTSVACACESVSISSTRQLDCSCLSQHADHAEGDVGGRRRLRHAPFVIGEHEHPSHCHFLLHDEPDAFRWGWQGLRGGVL